VTLLIRFPQFAKPGALLKTRLASRYKFFTSLRAPPNLMSPALLSSVSWPRPQPAQLTI